MGRLTHPTFFGNMIYIKRKVDTLVWKLRNQCFHHVKDNPISRTELQRTHRIFVKKHLWMCFSTLSNIWLICGVLDYETMIWFGKLSKPLWLYTKGNSPSSVSTWVILFWAMGHTGVLLESLTEWHLWASLVAQMVKNLPAKQETQVVSLGQEDPLEKGMATHSSILAWRISWTEEPGGLQSIESQRVRQDWAYLCVFVALMICFWYLLLSPKCIFRISFLR